MIPLSPEDDGTSLNQLIDHIRQAIRTCFKSIRLPPSSLASLVKGLTCVSLSLRPAHLIDICHVSTKQSQSLIAQLQKHPLGKGLVILQFKDRYTFVCQKTLLQEHVDTTLGAPDQWRYVDIRGKQGPPRQRSCPAVLLYWLQERLVPQLQQQRHYCYFDVLPSYMVALTGWFLEYPMLYCTHEDYDGAENDEPGETPATLLVDDELDEWQVRPNCLGDQPLCLVQVWIRQLFDQPHMLLSFTYPDEMDMPNPTQRLEEKYALRLGANHIRSSSVDVTLQHVCLDRVAL